MRFIIKSQAILNVQNVLNRNTNIHLYILSLGVLISPETAGRMLHESRNSKLRVDACCNTSIVAPLMCANLLNMNTNMYLYFNIGRLLENN